MAEEGVVGSPLGKSRTLDLSVLAVCFKTLLSGFAPIPSGPRCKETTVSMGQAKLKPISADSWGALAAFFQEDGYFTSIVAACCNVVHVVFLPHSPTTHRWWVPHGAGVLPLIIRDYSSQTNQLINQCS